MKWATVFIALGALSTQAYAHPMDTQGANLEMRDFDGIVTCGLFGDSAYPQSIETGIDYLNGVGGTPKQKPNSCGRVSCADMSAIYMCNWNDEDQYLKSFATIASGAQKIVDTCKDLGGPFNGMVAAPNGWGVLVRKDSNLC